ncbi:MAG: hypothetical protein AB9Q23_04645 [Candidatus Reddybacter sp.]
MSKISSIGLEWKYSPENYLEEPISFVFEGGTLEIQKGTALAIVDPITYQANDTLRDELTRRIKNRLHAVQLMTHKEFNLSKASRTDIREDGTKHHYLEVDSIVMKVSMGSPDLVVKDKNGNIVSDTKRERLDKQEWYASLVDKHRSLDLTLNQMLESYQASVSDPANELVHLYEIRDSLANKFRAKKSAVKNLGITTQQWDEIGELANSRPLKQGRHRGKSAGSLREAEAYELEQARKSVVYLVEKYLEFLDENQPH